ncbi:hypothetical protein [Streptomyces gilvosporeus]|uniref:Uncharacterized protein n=1 Tax=Streptomyces gilvosporeus TaxID=553510 RepID=A0A1V0TYH3_9ACTN|nr:hypothetical protein [Streptomyces gilvosporeus]ARF57937.1 hypothetical protein B1H19_30435 [Streptomyces gilvosporeus]
MRTRRLVFGLYADEAGLAWVKGIVAAAAQARGARVVAWAEEREILAGGVPVAEMYDLLVDQWGHENPGQDPGERSPVELRAGVVCSLRVWRDVRRTVLRRMCPEGRAPHACRVPWMAG